MPETRSRTPNVFIQGVSVKISHTSMCGYRTQNTVFNHSFMLQTRKTSHGNIFSYTKIVYTLRPSCTRELRCRTFSALLHANLDSSRFHASTREKSSFNRFFNQSSATYLHIVLSSFKLYKRLSKLSIYLSFTSGFHRDFGATSEISRHRARSLTRIILSLRSPVLHN